MATEDAQPGCKSKRADKNASRLVRLGHHTIRLVGKFWKWLFGLGVITIIGGIYTGLDRATSLWSKFVSIEVVEKYEIPLDADAKTLLRGDNVLLELKIYNSMNRQALPMSASNCELSGVPQGVIVTLTVGTHCSFTLMNAGLADPSGKWPVEGQVKIKGTNHGSAFDSDSVLLYFHDVAHPTIDTQSFAWVNDTLRVTAHIQPNREKQQAVVEWCEWRPADLFGVPTKAGPGCSAEFTPDAFADPMSSARKISVLVHFAVGSKSFSAKSDEVAVTVPPRPVAVASAAARPPLRPEVAAPDRSPPRADVDNNAPQPPALAAPASQAHLMNATDLIAALAPYRDAERYSRLTAGLAQSAAPLTAAQAVLLLGPLPGVLRRSALSNWLLPRMTTPISTDDALGLLSGLEPPDRADVLRSIAGCIASLPDKGRLLSGLVGVDRQSAASALDAQQTCNIRQPGIK